jgi:hypothetical protein
MPAAILHQQVLHIFKKFNMSTLVTGNGYSLYIFLNSGLNDLFYRAVMSQVNDLSAFALHDAPHDIDRGIMPVEQGGSGNDPDFICGAITHKKWLFSERQS